jgi:hypothetical protein
MRQFDMADQSLASDQESLADLVGELERSVWEQGGLDSPDALSALNDLLNSPRMRQAQDMASRTPMLQGRYGSPWRRGNPYALPYAPPAAETVREIDPELRTVVLKLQPALREELLQGMQEEGPESYRAFIRNYFRELTRVKGGP